MKSVQMWCGRSADLEREGVCVEALVRLPHVCVLQTCSPPHWWWDMATGSLCIHESWMADTTRSEKILSSMARRNSLSHKLYQVWLPSTIGVTHYSGWTLSCTLVFNSSFKEPSSEKWKRTLFFSWEEQCILNVMTLPFVLTPPKS